VSERSIFGRGNYVRNAAKFVIDAKDGTLTGYVWDEDDPILQAWLKVFPDLLKPKSEIPGAILEHVRYPEGLFRVQSNRYVAYHITDPVNFYSQEDVWAIALDRTVDPDSTDPPPVPAYYVLQQLPGERDLDFVLVRPFAPLQRKNLSGYLVAHGDHDDYGRLVEYRFPDSDVIFGPEQVFARINNDPVVSQQVNLWSQQQSKVIWGNTLIVPIDESLLYVQPIYLQAEGSSLPELKRVVAVVGERIRMANTLSDALGAIFGAEPGGGDEPPSTRSVLVLIQRALDADRLAQEALRAGDFAEYGRQQERMRRFLRQAAAAEGDRDNR
jgi:uncharacterized membrane protein (UPF0182 family)